MAKKRSRNVRLQKLLDDASTGFFLLDRDRRVVFANQAVLSMAGVELEEVLGQVCDFGSPGTESHVEDCRALLAPPPEVRGGGAIQLTRTWVANGSELSLLFVPFAVGDSEFVVAGWIRPERWQLVGLPGDWHQRLQTIRASLADRYGSGRIVALSAPMHRVLRQVELAAGCRHPVWICGEPGTEQDLLARAIHYHRDGSGGFLQVCGTRLSRDPPTLRILAQVVAGEIGDGLPRTVYIKNLFDCPERLLDEIIQSLDNPVVETRWIVAAEAAPLQFEAARSRVACALSAIPIQIPPLRHREHEFPLIAQQLLEDRNRDNASQVRGITSEAMHRLMNHDWPGNLAELDGVLEAAHRNADGPRIELSDLPADFRIPPAPVRPLKIDLAAELLRFEKSLIEEALSRSQGSKSKACELLSVSRSRLYRRMQAVGLIDEAAEGGGYE